jgi:hypothetical protein
MVQYPDGAIPCWVLRAGNVAIGDDPCHRHSHRLAGSRASAYPPLHPPSADYYMINDKG